MTPAMAVTTGASGAWTHGMSCDIGGNRLLGTIDSEPASGRVTYRLSSDELRTMRERRPWKADGSVVLIPKRPPRSGRVTWPIMLPLVGSMRSTVLGWD